MSWPPKKPYSAGKKRCGHSPEGDVLKVKGRGHSPEDDVLQVKGVLNDASGGDSNPQNVLLVWDEPGVCDALQITLLDSGVVPKGPDRCRMLWFQLFHPIHLHLINQGCAALKCTQGTVSSDELIDYGTGTEWGTHRVLAVRVGDAEHFHSPDHGLHGGVDVLEDQPESTSPLHPVESELRLTGREICMAPPLIPQPPTLSGGLETAHSSACGWCFCFSQEPH
ncbi:hypothetical protein JZ751_029691 [Albula glossodonta]|uniref:Uncharacterized protein n=1 Tax=Albula glossodonta TaxID=121402 RepID=A0A8T2NEB0_9TELE|nr:hypothetical protein JZ751_029691 [Albula glossodonta]